MRSMRGVLFSVVEVQLEGAHRHTSLASGKVKNNLASAIAVVTDTKFWEIDPGPAFYAFHA